MNQGQEMLSSLTLVLKRRSLPATATFISVILGALLYLILTPRQYEGLVRLTLDEKQISVSPIGQDLTPISNYVPGEYSLLADKAELIESPEVLRRAIALVYQDNSPAVEKPSVSKLRRQIDVKLFPATSILELSYQHQNPEIAARTVDAIAETMVNKSKQDIRAEAENQERELQAQIHEKRARVPQLQPTVRIDNPENADVLARKIQPLAELVRRRKEAHDSLEFLQQKLEEARIAEVQLFSDLKIVERAEIPNTHSSPNPPVVLAIASLIAGIMSCCMILIVEVLDNTLHDLEEVERKLDLPMLGTPPTLPPEAICLEPANRFLDDTSLVEPYRVFLKNLESRATRKLHMLTISSTILGEGKSIVASHLAAVSAMLFRRTLIVDADLHRPQQHHIFKIDSQPGLSEVIRADISLSDAIQKTNTSNLHILTCGQLPALPSVLLDSWEMKQVLAEAASMFDLVIIDSPPVSSCADARTLSHQSNGLVMVTRPQVTPKNILARAVSDLKRNQVEVLGFAINGNTSQTKKYYCRYSYDPYPSTASLKLLAPAQNNGRGFN